MSKGAYVGLNTLIPTENRAYCSENFNYFFDTKDNYLSGLEELPIITSPSGEGNVNFSAPNTAKNSFSVTYTAKIDILNFSLTYDYSINSENIATLQINEETIFRSESSGTENRGSWSGNLKQGDYIRMIYLVDNFVENNYFILVTNTSTTAPANFINKEVARKVSKMYVGVETEVPVYETTTDTNTYNFTYDNKALFFGDNSGTTTSNWTISTNSNGGVKLVPNNFGVNSSTATITLTALKDLTNVTIKGIYYTESRCDKITLVAGGTTALNAVSGTSSTLTTHYTGNLTTGQTIKFTYTKDSSVDGPSGDAEKEKLTYFLLDCDNITVTTTTQEIVGYEKKPIARKIKKGYLSVDGIARLFYDPTPYRYTGTYTETSVTVNDDDKPYILLTLTGSGSLNISDDVEYWMCAAGNKGCYLLNYIESTNGVSGYGGGGGAISSGVLPAGTYSVTIGAGGSDIGGSTNIGTIAAENLNSDASVGASGGGGSILLLSNGEIYPNEGAAGAGISTIPFSGRVVHPSTQYKHSAGGAGGFVFLPGVCAVGGNGGTNGGDGEESSGEVSTSGTISGSHGGERGGGHPSEDATFYGSGGGGAGSYYFNDVGGVFTVAGNGYQGVVYLLIPVVG